MVLKNLNFGVKLKVINMKLEEYDQIHLNKKVARLRHCNTTYNRNLDIMYDETGKPTELRKEINNLLFKIATGELDPSYLSGINSEIKYVKNKVKKDKKKEEKVSKKKHKNLGPSIAKQQAALWTGIKRIQENNLTGQQYKYLGTIGLRPHQLHKMYRKALPKPMEE